MESVYHLKDLRSRCHGAIVRRIRFQNGQYLSQKVIGYDIPSGEHIEVQSPPQYNDGKVGYQINEYTIKLQCFSSDAIQTFLEPFRRKITKVSLKHKQLLEDRHTLLYKLSIRAMLSGSS